METAEKALWVIGDIHGMYDPLRRMIDRIRSVEYFQASKRPEEARNTTLIFIGDYIDYGPSSKQVIDLLLEIKKEFRCVFLCGNHEDMMLQFLKHSDLFDRFGNMWFRGAGGQSTVVSFMPQPEIYQRVYGTQDDHQKFTKDEFILDQVYLDFFDSLVYAHTETFESDGQVRKFAFTHASLLGKQQAEESFVLDKIEVDTAEQLAIKTYDDFHAFRTEKKIWIEELHLWNRALPTEKYDDYILIHGHTPTPLYDLKYKEFGSFKPESLLPYVRFIENDAETHKGYYDMSFNRSLDDIISINIDTGVAYGKALTALYITESDLLYGHRFRVYQTRVDCPRIEPDITSMEWKFYG